MSCINSVFFFFFYWPFGFLFRWIETSLYKEGRHRQASPLKYFHCWSKTDLSSSWMSPLRQGKGQKLLWTKKRYSLNCLRLSDEKMFSCSNLSHDWERNLKELIMWRTHPTPLPVPSSSKTRPTFRRTNIQTRHIGFVELGGRSSLFCPLKRMLKSYWSVNISSSLWLAVTFFVQPWLMINFVRHFNLSFSLKRFS